MRREVRTHAIPKGYLSTTLDNYLNGTCPTRLTLAFVSSAAYNGSYTKNPFNMQNFNLKDLAVYVDGVTIPGRPLRLHFEENEWDTPAGNQYVTSYLNMFAGTSKLGSACGGNGIKRPDFMKGYALYVFPLDPYLDGLTDGSHLPLQHHCNVRLEIVFGKALPETVNLIVMSEYTSLFEIDQARNVLFNP